MRGNRRYGANGARSAVSCEGVRAFHACIGCYPGARKRIKAQPVSSSWIGSLLFFSSFNPPDRVPDLLLHLPDPPDAILPDGLRTYRDGTVLGKIDPAFRHCHLSDRHALTHSIDVINLCSSGRNEFGFLQCWQIKYVSKVELLPIDKIMLAARQTSCPVCGHRATMTRPPNPWSAIKVHSALKNHPNP